MTNSKILKTVEWAIDIPDIPEKLNENKIVYSSIFCMELNSVITYWVLCYNLNHENKQKFGVFLQRLSHPATIEFDIKFSALTANGLCSPFSPVEIPKSMWSTDKSTGQLLMSSKVLKEKRYKLCPDGKFHLMIKITAINLNFTQNNFADPKVSLIESMNLKIDSNSARSEDVIFDMITTLPQSDVLIKTDDGMVLKAHKSVLSEKSSVFKSMFTIDMEETANKSVDVIEFKGPVIKELMGFIYFNKVQNIRKVNIELFKAAKVYEIAELPEICLKSIIDVGINHKNVIDVVQLADVYDFHDLFLHCCDKIRNFRHHPVVQSKLKELEMRLQIRITDRIITKMTTSEIFVTVETCNYAK